MRQDAPPGADADSYLLDSCQVHIAKAGYWDTPLPVGGMPELYWGHHG